MIRAISSAMLMACLAACGPGPEVSESPPASDIRLYVLNCGHIDVRDMSAFGSEGEYDGQAGELAAMCFLIRHPDGDLIWDAGLSDSINALPGGLELDAGFVSVPVTLTSQIESLGLTFDDIEYFAPSHSHWDHVGNAELLSGSTLLIHSAELDYMFGEGLETLAVQAQLVEPLKDSETVKFTEEYDVFGDGRVKIVPMPGHTPGHSVLFIDLTNEGPVYLSGDLYHQIRSRRERIVPAFNVSKPQTLESIEAFEARVSAENARVIIQHAMEDQAALPDIPSYLD